MKVRHLIRILLQLLKVSETIYSLKWYEREAHQQKYFLFFILRAQKPYYMRGVKMITCSLETFTHVSLTICFLKQRDKHF